MRSTFARQFGLTAGLIILCVAFLGAGFRMLMYNNLVVQERESLVNNANAVAQLASAYDTTGELAQNWDFRMTLSFTAQIAESDIIIFGKDGAAVICSCQDLNCAHQGKVLSSDIRDEVANSGSYYGHDTLGGLYEEDRYFTAVPVISATTGATTGIALVSSQADDIRMVLTATFEVFFFSAAIVLLIAMAATSILARAEAEQLKSLANTASRFGHGDMKARAVLSDKNTVEMNELATEFNNMAVSLEQSELRRREFVANISHELKTPMTTIAGFMDGMVDGTIPPARHRQYMITVSEEVRRLSRLVHTMLDISRLQSQGIPESRKQRFNITESVGQVLLTFEHKINEKDIQVEADLPDNPVFVWGELDALTQVLSNLTDNAVKFCPQGGQLWVRVTHTGGKAKIAVGNTGNTIPAQELPLLFDRFHKMDKSRSKDREGYGLGLYIVKTIMDSHGETILVSSEEGKTEFSFHLPMKK
ncbi:MAG: HAMP domain-containing sensor histidine kinase [Eubacteriales bacterium]